MYAAWQPIWVLAAAVEVGPIPPVGLPVPSPRLDDANASKGADSAMSLKAAPRRDDHGHEHEGIPTPPAGPQG